MYQIIGHIKVKRTSSMWCFTPYNARRYYFWRYDFLWVFFTLSYWDVQHAL